MTTQPWVPLWQSISERWSYTGSPGIVPGWLPNHSVRTPELHRQSWDCHGMTTQPLGPPCQSIPEHRSYTSSPGIVLGWLPNPLDLSGRVSQNAGVTPAVPGLSRDGYPTTLSERQSYTSSPGIVLGWLPNPWDLSGRVSQNAGVTPAVPGLSRDGYPTTLSERQSYTGSPGIVQGIGSLPNPWDLSGRVSQNAGVTPAVPGLSQDDYPTPLSEYPRTPELHRQSQDCPGMTTQLLCHPGTAGVTPAFWDTLADRSQGLGSHPGTIPGLPV